MKNLFDIHLSLPDLMNLTIQKLQDMTLSEESDGSKTSSDNVTKQQAEAVKRFAVPKDCVVQLSAGQPDKIPVIVLHDLDGKYQRFYLLLTLTCLMSQNVHDSSNFADFVLCF
jgi:hypothetical protein